MEKVGELPAKLKKGPKNTPAKTTYDENVVEFMARTVLGVKNTPAKRT